MDNIGNKEGIREIIEKYRADVTEMTRYLGWLESKRSESLSSSYDPADGRGETITFPVYDGTLMNFVRSAEKTGLIDRNYVYTYKKYRILTVADELRFIENAQITDMKTLADILSSYIVRGRTKGVVWPEGVNNGVYYAVISKMKELIEFWTMPYGQGK